MPIVRKEFTYRDYHRAHGVNLSLWAKHVGQPLTALSTRMGLRSNAFSRYINTKQLPWSVWRRLVALHGAHGQHPLRVRAQIPAYLPEAFRSFDGPEGAPVAAPAPVVEAVVAPVLEEPKSDEHRNLREAVALVVEMCGQKDVQLALAMRREQQLEIECRQLRSRLEQIERDLDLATAPSVPGTPPPTPPRAEAVEQVAKSVRTVGNGHGVAPAAQKVVESLESRLPKPLGLH